MFPNKDVVSLSIKASVGEVTPVMPFEVCDEQVPECRVCGSN